MGTWKTPPPRGHPPPAPLPRSGSGPPLPAPLASSVVEAGTLTSTQCQKPLWVGASGSKQVIVKLLVSSGKPDQRSCGEWSESPPAIGATKLWSISSPSLTSSLESVNDGLAGSRS